MSDVKTIMQRKLYNKYSPYDVTELEILKNEVQSLQELVINLVVLLDEYRLINKSQVEDL